MFNKRLSRTRSLWLSWMPHRMYPLRFYRLLTWKASEVYLITKMCGCPPAAKIYSQNTFREPWFCFISSSYMGTFWFALQNLPCCYAVIYLDDKMQLARLCNGICTLCERWSPLSAAFFHDVQISSQLVSLLREPQPPPTPKKNVGLL